MTRSHRSVHRGLWIGLALVMAFGLVLALLLRAPAHAETPVASGTVQT
jgi:hypothetical protein